MIGIRGWLEVPCMLGELSRPYCWAAKSMTKLAGAWEVCELHFLTWFSRAGMGETEMFTSHFAVEYETPMI